jgi:hypothetical protein
MKACVWYDMDERIPTVSGYYLAFKGMSMGDDETGCDYYYWNAKSAEWRDSQISSSYSVNVIYWTEADPAAWYSTYRFRQKSGALPVAEQDAWNAVQQAIEKYEMVKALTKV